MCKNNVKSVSPLFQAVNESINETLPILRFNSSALSTITKRRKHKIFQPLEFVQGNIYVLFKWYIMYRSNCTARYLVIHTSNNKHVNLEVARM